MTSRDILPTVRMVLILRERPSRMMANFKSFLDVNFKPGAKAFVFFNAPLRIIPKNIAMTAAPTTWIGNRLSKKHATTAMATDSTVPGITFKYFILKRFKTTS